MSGHTTQASGPIASSARSIRLAKRAGSGPSFVPRLTMTVLGCTTFSAERSATRPCGVVRPLLASHAMSSPSSRPSDGRRPTASESPTTSTRAEASAGVTRAEAAAGRIRTAAQVSAAAYRRRRGIERVYRQPCSTSEELLYGFLQVRREGRGEDGGEVIDVLERERATDHGIARTPVAHRVGQVDRAHVPASVAGADGRHGGIGLQ